MSEIDKERLKIATDFIGESSKKEVISIDENRYRSVRFFKEYARNPTRTYSEVAAKLGIPKRTAEDYVERYLYLNTVLKDRNKIGPNGKNEAVELILSYFNEDLAKSGIPRGEMITAGEISRLAEVLRRYEYMYSVYTNDEDSELNMNVTDNNRNMSYPQQDSYEEEYDEADATPEGILKKILVSNRRAIMPTKIPSLLNLFRLNPNKYIANPDALKALLIMHLEPQHRANADSMVYLFQQMVQDMNPAFGAGTGQVPVQGIYPAMQANFAQQQAEQRMRIKQMEDEQFNEQLNKMMKLTLMQSLKASAGGPSGGGGNDDFMKMLLLSGGMRAQMKFDPTTQSNQLEFVPSSQAGGNGNGLENNLIATVLTKLVDKSLSGEGDSLTKILLPKLIESNFNRPSILQEIEQYKALQGFINPTSGPRSSEELSFDHKNRELDLKEKLLMRDLELKNDKEKYERDLHIKEQERADNTLNMVIQSINGIAERAGPYIGKFLNPQPPPQNPVQEVYDEVPMQGGMEVDPYAAFNGQPVSDQALYGAMDERINRSVEENRRYTTDAVNEIKNVVREVQAPRQHDLDIPVEQPQEEFAPTDFSKATTEELMKVKQEYELEKNKFETERQSFTSYGEMLENELRKRNQQNYNYENIQELDTDYTGFEESEKPVEETPQQETLGEMSLEVPKLNELEEKEITSMNYTDEKPPEDIPVKDPEPEPAQIPEPEPEELPTELDEDSHDSFVASIKLDENVEKKLEDMSKSETEEPKKKTRKKKDPKK